MMMNGVNLGFLKMGVYLKTWVCNTDILAVMGL